MKKIITLGEILIRYSTNMGETLDSCQTLHSHYGGSEANVSTSLSSLGHEAMMLSKLPDNPLGVGAIRHLNKYGVNTNYIELGGERIGSYYLESGAGIRAASVLYDRKYSSFSVMSKFSWQADELFDENTIFHVTGITLALSETIAEETIRLVKEAKKLGAKVSFDSNYRSKLWTIEKASRVIKKILPFVDYCSMGELDALNLVGIPDTDKQAKVERITYFYDEMNAKFPNISVFFSTFREVISSNENKLTGTFWKDGKTFISNEYHIPYIVDRVGGGDAFTAGILHGLIENLENQAIVEFGTALSMLKHTISGDVISYSVEQINAFIESDSSKISR